VPPYARTLALAILARLPPAALGLVLIVTMEDRGHGYGVAGLCSAAAAAGMALGAPLLGRLIDTRGQARVLLVATALTAAAMATFALLPASAPVALCAALALVVGVSLPPIPACARAIWSATLERRQFNAAVSLDASLQELAFMGGPLLLVTMATAWSPTAALLTGATLIALTTLVFTATRESRAMRGIDVEAGQVAGTGLGALHFGGVRTLTIIAVAMGVVFGATEFGIVAAADEGDAKGATGVLFALWGMGSIVAGLAIARWPVDLRADVWFAVLMATIGVATLGLAAAPSVVWLGALLVLAGAAVAPLFGLIYALTPRLAPQAMLTEAYSLQASGTMAGVAIGSASSGVLAGAAGVSAAFLLGAAAVVLGAGAALLRRDSLPHEPLAGAHA